MILSLYKHNFDQVKSNEAPYIFNATVLRNLPIFISLYQFSVLSSYRQAARWLRSLLLVEINAVFQSCEHLPGGCETRIGGQKHVHEAFASPNLRISELLKQLLEGSSSDLCRKWR